MGEEKEQRPSHPVCVKKKSKKVQSQRSVGASSAVVHSSKYASSFNSPKFDVSSFSRSSLDDEDETANRRCTTIQNDTSYTCSFINKEKSCGVRKKHRQRCSLSTKHFHGPSSIVNETTKPFIRDELDDESKSSEDGNDDDDSGCVSGESSLEDNEEDVDEIRNRCNVRSDKLNPFHSWKSTWRPHKSSQKDVSTSTSSLCQCDANNKQNTMLINQSDQYSSFNRKWKISATPTLISQTLVILQHLTKRCVRLHPSLNVILTLSIILGITFNSIVWLQKPSPDLINLLDMEIKKDFLSNTTIMTQVDMMGKGGTGLEMEREERKMSREKSSNKETASSTLSENGGGTSTSDVINIAFVSCGSGEIQMREVDVMLKSVLLSTEHSVHFIAFVDKLGSHITRKLQMWNDTGLFPPITLDLRHPHYPLNNAMASIEHKFAPCATLRLFFPELLPTYDRILYVDTDVLFLRSPYLIWSHFHRMNSSQLIGLAVENSNKYYSSYSDRFSNVPHIEQGLNSGVALMDLGRMREHNWMKYMQHIYNHYQNYFIFCDQDILNIYARFNPHKYYVLPCQANFRPDFCLSIEESCPLEDANSIVLLHGNRGVFHNTKDNIQNIIATFMRNIYLLTKNINYLIYGVRILSTSVLQSVYSSLHDKYSTIDVEVDFIPALDTSSILAYDNCAKIVPNINDLIHKSNDRKLSKLSERY